MKKASRSQEQEDEKEGGGARLINTSLTNTEYLSLLAMGEQTLRILERDIIFIEGLCVRRASHDVRDGSAAYSSWYRCCLDLMQNWRTVLQ